ncbi:hypothetical protein TNCV_4852951 [Trichonephila clavipes]|nr:hypothetical protein TNCV_4852951 [Trichonephila clavipes]
MNVQDSTSVGEDTMNDTQIKKESNRFKSDRKNVQNDQRFGKQQTSQNAAVIEKTENLAMKNSCLTAQERLRKQIWCCGSPVVKVSDLGRYVTSSSPVPLKTHRVGQRCTLNLSRVETS